MKNECNQYNKTAIEFVGDVGPPWYLLRVGITHTNQEPLEATLLSPMRNLLTRPMKTILEPL